MSRDSQVKEVPRRASGRGWLCISCSHLNVCKIQQKRDGGTVTRGHICGITRAAEVPETSGSHDAPERDQKRTGEERPAKLVDRGPELEAGELAGCMYRASVCRIERVRLGARR